ncbi:Hypothetical_protein [Hexamita inflata]|uniref:Hypothetical_protein n=1 Tax=Hexamita inflata TaxID=28002 RepID=A0AA86TFZ7_9EUKA|nr:Hypothetical protein HINF_LOCUS3901 [Hexamita inflata]
MVKHVRRSYEYIHSDSETIHGLALSLESIDDVLGSNSLTLSVISVDERVTDDNVEESLQDMLDITKEMITKEWLSKQNCVQICTKYTIIIYKKHNIKCQLNNVLKHLCKICIVNIVLQDRFQDQQSI